MEPHVLSCPSWLSVLPAGASGSLLPLCHEGCSHPPCSEHVGLWCWKRMHQGVPGEHRGCWDCLHCGLRELDAVSQLGTWKGNAGFAPWAVLPAQDQGGSSRQSSTWSSTTLLDAVVVGRSSLSPERFASLITKAGGTAAFMDRRIGTRRSYTTDIRAACGRSQSFIPVSPRTQKKFNQGCILSLYNHVNLEQLPWNYSVLTCPEPALRW